jgi:protein-glutamine gamma-glutamyltransferase
MTFAQYFKASSYCMIGAGFAAIAATGALDWISILLFSGVLAGSWFVDTARLRQHIPSWILNCLVLIYLPVFIIDHRTFSRSFMIAIVHLLLFIAALKLLTLSKDRDYLLLYIISFAELLVSSTLTVSMLFILCFLFFLFSGVTTLILFEMRRSNARMQGEGRVQPLVVSKKLQGTGLELFSPFPAGLLSAMAIGISLLIILVAIPLFFLLPRVAFGIYRSPSGNTQFISGFSDHVELGRIGSIKQSDSIVMRVKTDKAPSELPADLKWRGIALDYYDGHSWKRSDKTRYPLLNQGLYYKLEDSAQGTTWINQTFFIEALSTDVIFAAHKVLAISRDVGVLERDAAKSLYTMQHLNRKVRYHAISDSVRPDPLLITDRSPIPPEILTKYLQIPSLDPRIADLARQATKTAGSRHAKARMLEQYLRSHYAYSLVLRGIPSSPDPLAMFLFDIRSGHCEYFASAMVVMLRQIGIPARLINGFRSGEYNSIGGNWIVRQYDAHSWVEAYFPPYGWIEFDPTPADPQHPRMAFMRIISNLADAIDLWWWEGVVNYDPTKQYHAIGALYRWTGSLQQSLKSFLDLVYEKCRAGMAIACTPGLSLTFGKKWLPLLPCLTVGILLLIKPVRRRVFNRTKRMLYRSDSQSIVASYFREALELLEANGFKRNRDETPMEFARNLRDHPAANSFLGLTCLYNESRFGHPETCPLPLEAETLLLTLRASFIRDKRTSSED